MRTAQKEGALAAKLLESVGSNANPRPETPPVFRLARPTPLLTTEARPLPEKRTLRRPITFETVHGDKAVSFSGSPTHVQAWLPDGKQFLQVREGRLQRVQAETGKARPMLNSNAVFQALRRLELDEKTAASICRRTRFELNPDATGALLNHNNDLYFFRFDGSEAARLTRTPAPEELAAFSPNGRRVAFVRADNLYVVDLATQTERALTSDGGGDVRNGKADWVYYEEIQNRNWRTFWWSPDSAQLAFERFDAAALPMFHALDTLDPHGRLESMRHPKAGDPNPAVKLGVVSATGGPVSWVDLSAYAPDSFVISQAGWLPDSDGVYFYAQDRVQTWLDFNVWRLDNRRTERYYREKSPAWIESPGEPSFLKQGDFIIPSDRTGWNHLYRFSTKNKTWTPVTRGEWEVRRLHAVNEKTGWVYFTGTRDSAIAENLYRCRLDGSELTRLTSFEGEHRVGLDPTARFFVDTWSDYRTPEQVRLYRTDGRFVRTLDANPVFVREEYEWGETSLFQIPAKDGFLLEAGLVKPVNFSPGQRYPVWFMTYAGPRMPTMHNGWAGGRVEDHMLAQRGLIVFRMDPRSASGKGSCSAWTAYRKLGVRELEDITEAIEWLKAKPFIDGARIGMSGHSYGGFMTAFALTHSKLFAAGIAGAPVTDWRYYDSIYTERYMDLPKDNPAGYAASSVVDAAKNLHGRLLLLHGMMDDNVHLQNATAFIDALQKANRDFELMFYPQMLHGLYGAHYHRQIMSFIDRTLLQKESVPKLETTGK